MLKQLLVLCFLSAWSFLPVAFCQTKHLNWAEMHDMNLYVDQTRENTARFFISEDKAKIMVVSEELGTAWILLIKTGTFALLSLEAISFDDEAELAITEDRPISETAGRFTRVNENVQLNFHGAAISIGPRPALIGKTSVQDLLNHAPYYERLMRGYEPNPEFVSLLAKFNIPVEIVVGFGTWCSHCKAMVPQLIKTLRVAQNANLNTTYYSVNESLTLPAAFLENYSISMVPTVIVRYQGKELGRIEGEVKHSVETDLAALLLKAYLQK